MPGLHQGAHPRGGQSQGGSLQKSMPAEGHKHFGSKLPTGPYGHTPLHHSHRRQHSGCGCRGQILTKVFISWESKDGFVGAWQKNPSTLPTCSLTRPAWS